MKEWGATDPSPSEMAVLVDGEGQPTPRYLADHESPKTGKLSDLWEQWPNSALFSTLIDVVAQAWQITPTDLVKQEIWTHSTNRVLCRVQHP
jgi:hypothetical protein